MTFRPDAQADALMAVWAAQLMQARLKLGLNQNQVGEILGVPRGTVGGWERLRYRPDTTTWIKWARALGWEMMVLPLDTEEEGEGL